VCPAGKGEANGTCIDCSAGSWNDGSSLFCQNTCGNISFTYPGKSDRLFGGVVTPVGAMGDDQCLSLYSQLYQEQGVYIADPDQFNLTKVIGAVSSVNECAAACNSSACQYFTFLYDDNVKDNSNGTCYIKSTPSGVPAAKKVFYKMIPTQDVAAQSVEGNSKGSSTSSGWYVKHGTVVGEQEQGINVTNPPDPASSLESCLLACDLDASCVLVYYDPAAAVGATKCSLKGGGAALLLRTAVHGISSKLVQAQKEDNSTCTSDIDCISNVCDPLKKVCMPSHCSNGVLDADEAYVDCGGADCLACPGKLKWHQLIPAELY
jgi:hypothetical protein